MKVNLISITKPLTGEGNLLTPENLMVYCARVSSPQNQDNIETGPKLLRYCMKKGHWSVFAMVDMTVEIETSRAISAQILRHKSFDFQEFSQRYGKITEFESYDARKQDPTNRQSSTDTLPPHVREWWAWAQRVVQNSSLDLYKAALDQGVAKESARFLLPMSATTRLYMKGSVRSWIHYLKVRLGPETQLEHREIARWVMTIFKEQFPIISEALEL